MVRKTTDLRDARPRHGAAGSPTAIGYSRSEPKNLRVQFNPKLRSSNARDGVSGFGSNIGERASTVNGRVKTSATNVSRRRNIFDSQAQQNAADNTNSVIGQRQQNSSRFDDEDLDGEILRGKLEKLGTAYLADHSGVAEKYQAYLEDDERMREWRSANSVEHMGAKVVLDDIRARSHPAMMAVMDALETKRIDGDAFYAMYDQTYGQDLYKTIEELLKNPQ